MEQLKNTSGYLEEASAIQTSKLATTFEYENRYILEKTGILSAVIIPENMVAMRVDLGILWEKLKCITR